MVKHNKYIIIGRSTCRFCVMAVDFCSANHAPYVFLDYHEREEILEDYKGFYKQDTVPIILQNNLSTGLTIVVGGYTDLLDALPKEEKCQKNKKR